MLTPALPQVPSMSRYTYRDYCGKNCPLKEEAIVWVTGDLPSDLPDTRDQACTG